eukprot:gnl/Dysnectes_brevis/592_a654_806.p1 GENE.gnl/Dysnectes_brevis/592_a654_806~~gnl/Dysnectes_brevis/592_a654_806.p1  ORF type:complete len:1101 (+),score=174.07 gnl/Dysnectes_brevis/592_a654_806:24-3326(+)
MITALRRKVSGKRIRYQDSDYNLDLTYITERIIAMSLPAEGFTSLFRNRVTDVASLLLEKHGEHFKVFNLAEKISYDFSKFNHQVRSFPFPDHSAPPINLLTTICSAIIAWFQAHPSNVAAVHCFAPGTHILREDGSMAMVDDLVEGDRVLGADGTPRTLTATMDGEGALYRIDYMNGDVRMEPLTVSGGHMLHLRDHEGQTVNITVEDYLSSSVPLSPVVYNTVVERPAARETHFVEERWGEGILLPGACIQLTPTLAWFFGVWLGNGSSNGPTLAMDPRYVRRTRDMMTEWGNGYGLDVLRDHSNVSFTDESGSDQDNLFFRLLLSLGFAVPTDDHFLKRVPECIHTWPSGMRFAFLSGLADSCGETRPDAPSVTIRQGVDPSTTNGEHTVTDNRPEGWHGHLVRLGSSLGCHVSSCGTGYKSVREWRFMFGKNQEIIRFNEAAVFRRCGLLTSPVPCSLEVTPVAPGRYLGFECDGDHLFVAGNMTVQHNCKAGRGRTGTVIACLLVQMGLPPPYAIRRFNYRRSTQGSQGMSVPSQKRYVGYYGQLLTLEEGEVPRRAVRLDRAELLLGPDYPTVWFLDINGTRVEGRPKMGPPEAYWGQCWGELGTWRWIEFDLCSTMVRTDFCLDLVVQGRRAKGKSKLFGRASFHPAFLSDPVVLSRTDLDGQHKLEDGDFMRFKLSWSLSDEGDGEEGALEPILLPPPCSPGDSLGSPGRERSGSRLRLHPQSYDSEARGPGVTVPIPPSLRSLPVSEVVCAAVGSRMVFIADAALSDVWLIPVEEVFSGQLGTRPVPQRLPSAEAMSSYHGEVGLLRGNCVTIHSHNGTIPNTETVALPPNTPSYSGLTALPQLYLTEDHVVVARGPDVTICGRDGSQRPQLPPLPAPVRGAAQLGPALYLLAGTGLHLVQGHVLTEVEISLGSSPSTASSTPAHSFSIEKPMLRGPLSLESPVGIKRSSFSIPSAPASVSSHRGRHGDAGEHWVRLLACPRPRRLLLLGPDGAWALTGRGPILSRIWRCSLPRHPILKRGMPHVDTGVLSDPDGVFSLVAIGGRDLVTYGSISGRLEMQASLPFPGLCLLGDHLLCRDGGHLRGLLIEST